jgi:hypothetical protein
MGGELHVNGSASESRWHLLAPPPTCIFGLASHWCSVFATFAHLMTSLASAEAENLL